MDCFSIYHTYVGRGGWMNLVNLPRHICTNSTVYLPQKKKYDFSVLYVGVGTLAEINFPPTWYFHRCISSLFDAYFWHDECRRAAAQHYHT